ncbi:hypothetical protein [Xylanimonas sp. McL0601]|uniref:hypothetical protein n=1 Tax=Xylanimonas sp. McL0601 TaxID=3414739 RepID=UPI003CF067B4
MGVDVRSAVGRFGDFADLVGVKKPGGHGCWCSIAPRSSYRRLVNARTMRLNPYRTP